MRLGPGLVLAWWGCVCVGLEVSEEPSDLTVADGEDAALECTPDPPHAEVEWRRSGEMGGVDGTPVGRGRRLELRGVSAGSGLEGFYRCFVRLDGDAAVSRAASVSVPRLGELSAWPRDLSLSPGQTAFFPCALASDPRSPLSPLSSRPRTAWSKEESPLRADDERHTLAPSGALQIDTVDARDAGTYRCNVTVPGAPGFRLSPPARLSVDASEGGAQPDAPEFVARPRSLSIVEGEAAAMDCAALGNPHAEIVWLRAGNPVDLSLGGRFSLVGSGVLLVDPVKESDAGPYQCRAESRRDSSDATAFLEVLVPPRFVKRPQDTVASERGDAELECQIYGRPEPTVRWLKNGETVSPNNHDVTLSNGHNLKIQGLMPTDSGTFQCIGFNSAGNIQASARLTVIGSETSPEKEHVRKSPVKKRPDKATSSNSTFDSKYILSSLISSDPYSGGTRPESSDESPISPVDVPAPESDAGIGRSEEDRERDTERTVPSEPLNLTAAIVRPRFVILSWNEPHTSDGEIEAYSILYKVVDSPRERMINTTRKDIHEMNVSRLRPNTAYRFRVLAVNENGAGPTSAPLYVTTQSEDQSLGPPVNLTVVDVSSTSVRILWQPPERIPGSKLTVDKYRLFWTKVDEQDVLTDEENSVITDGPFHRLGNLTPFTEYGIRVVALSAGSTSGSPDSAGTPTDLIFTKTLGDIPSAPPQNVTFEILGSTSLKVQWEPPPYGARNGDITGYKLRHKKLGRKRAESYSTTANSKSAILKDLEHAATYQIRICAFNVNGTGPYTEWYNVEMLQNDFDETQVPGAPGPINAKPGLDSIFVSWAPPQHQNIKIRSYKLSWGKGVPDDDRKILGDSARHFTIKNLERNAEYVISLTAFNEMGGGIPTYTTVRTLEKIVRETDPDENDVDPLDNGIVSNHNSQSTFSPPVGLQADILSGTTAVVYWTDITLPKSQIIADQRHYVVKYSILGSQKFRYFNTTNLNLMIDELKPNTKYEFSVKMVKGDQETPWSMVVINGTLEASPASFPRELSVTPLSDSSSAVTLHWLAPSKANGIITGYVILYTYDRTRRDRDWIVQAVVGSGTSALVSSLKPSTAYYFKVQARNSKGYGPFSPVVTFVTNAGSDADETESTANKEIRQNHTLIVYSIVGVIAIFVVVGVIVTIIVCCRKSSSQPPLSPDNRGKNTYQKSSSSNIKPPDLWIHHDQMELKQMEKSHHSSTGSGDGSSAVSSMTLQRQPPRDSCEYDTAIPAGGTIHHPSTGSVDKRHYVPTYVAMSSINACGSGHLMGDGAGSNTVRSLYPRPQFSLGSNTRPHMTVDQNTPLLSAAGSSISGTLPSQSSMSSLGQTGGNTLPLHHHSVTGSLGISPVSCSQMSCGIGHAGSILHGPSSSPSPSPASEGFPADAREREQGHYVAYEALHPPKESIDGGMGSLSRTHAGPVHPLRSFSVPAPPPDEAPHTPHHHGKVSVTIRPTNTSPYKKPQSSVSVVSTRSNRLQHGVSVPHSSEEVEALAPSHSTERLHREMANLEGLMKDLSAITASQFEC